MKKAILMMCLSLSLVFATIGPIQAGDIGDELLAVMTAADPDTAIPVIIRLEDQEEIKTGNIRGRSAARISELLRQNAHAAQGLLRALLRAEGLQNIVSLWIINGIAVSLTPDQILAFAAHPNVKSIVLDDVVEAPVPPEPSEITGSGEAWNNLGAINTPPLWDQGIDGTGMVVAAMDTGVDLNHSDLSPAWRGGGNSWYDPNNEHAFPYDKTGHGTRVMGVLVGGSKSGVPIGVAPGARWIAVKIFNDAGVASYSAIHQGFQWLLDPDGLPDTEDAPHVVNNSWGLNDAAGNCITEFQTDAEILKAAGIALVFSAGNSGPGSHTSVSPANYPESFAVGAVDRNLAVASFSSRGPSACDGGVYPEVNAPGVDIYTTDKTYGGTYNLYTLATGTSFAAPHAAGSMALLRDAYPGAAVGELELALEDNTSGSGVIDVAAAYTQLANPPGCVDDDNDGYFASAGCGTPADCKDDDFNVNPATSEIKHDGIDQNCNGYDLTIDVLKAAYVSGEDTLAVEAVSDQGQKAALEVIGYGAMRWDRKTAKWTLSVRSAGGDPEKVVVSGIEGAVIAPTTVSEGSSPGKGGGKNKK